MLNKLLSFARSENMFSHGDRVVCAVSGGADSVALLFAMYLLAPKLGITLEAAHFNHGLRGEESDADAAFVQQLCDRLDIPLHMGQECVVAGKKGLEAAARNARYSFLESLSGKIATAHTADDNAETVLMHLVRGTGLRGLGGIMPIRGKVIRPMLTVTRQEVLAFLNEYHLSWREDSSNAKDDFLRNRLRHRVMPLLKEENPGIVQNLSKTALRLRLDEQLLSSMAELQDPTVEDLRRLPDPVRTRWIVSFLRENGVPEPEQSHISSVESLIFSQKPSASADLPGGVRVARRYDRLAVATEPQELTKQALTVPCAVEVSHAGIVVRAAEAHQLSKEPHCFAVCPQGTLCLRGREPGDTIRLPGGTKTLKKLFIDKKIPAADRVNIPVIADERGVLGVYGIGPNLDRIADTFPAVEISFEKI